MEEAFTSNGVPLEVGLGEANAWNAA